MTERRRHVRFNTSLSIFCSSVEKSLTRFQTKITDLSREGARLFSHEKLEEGSPVDIEFSIPGDNIPVFAAGEVCWSKESTDGTTSGVRFTKIAPRDKAKVLEYLYKNWIGSKL